MKYFKLKLNSFKNNLILAGFIFCIALGIFVYVNYLINKPLDMEIPKHFIYNNTNIALAWTDDNTGENLIIQSDKKEYSGFSGVDVYFSITNTSRKDQDADIVIWLPSDKTKAEKVERINKDGSNFQFSIFNFEINSNFKVKNRKDVGKSSTGDAINDKIKSGETNYYKATIKYPSMSKGEFFIEAFGDNGAYGHLDPWYSSDWNYKRKITINASQIATTTSAFPVLATTTLADLKTVANGGKVGNDNGYDIIFVDDDDSTLLNFEREKYASTTGEIVYWIKTDISSTTDKTIYMYYGNASATDQATTTGVWDDNYVMVQHMQETPAGTTYDSTQYSNDGTTQNMDSADQVAGQIDGSLDFDGTDNYIDCGNDSSINNMDTISVAFWMHPNITGGWTRLIDKEELWIMTDSFSHKSLTFYIDGSGADTKAEYYDTVIIDERQYIVFIWDGTMASSGFQLYWNGVEKGEPDEVASGGTRKDDSSYNLLIGGKSTDNYFDGIIDEVRISNIARSAGWIETEYNNQSDVGSFMTIGEEEDKIPTITFVEDSPDPAQHSSTVTFSVDWDDSDSSNIKVKICKTDSLTNQNCDGGYYASSTVFTANDPETVTYTVEDDDLGTKHYYAFVCDSDGNCSDSAHGSFTIRTTQINSSSANNENWYNANWKYKRAITLDSSRIATTTSDFPVLATTTLADLKSYAHDGNVGNSNGYDIIFVDSDNKTLLNFEREKYDPTTGEIVYWIKTDISSTTDKIIYMYYGNASATDQATTTGVWDDNYVMVQHMQETPAGTTYDSTQYSNDGTTQNMDSADQVAGQMDGSLDFNANGEYVSIGTESVEISGGTLSFWWQPNFDYNESDTNAYLFVGNNAYPNDGLYLRYKTSNGSAEHEFRFQLNVNYTVSIQLRTKDLTSPCIFVAGDWVYITTVWNSDGSAELYINKVIPEYDDKIENSYIPANYTESNYYVGGYSDGNANGIIDEVRVSNIARSAGWIETEYNNQSAVGNFMTIGEKESLNRTAIINAPIKNYLTDGLVGHWTFNGEDMDWGSSTAEALDSSGNNNNGNVINGAKAVIGKAGQGLEFDGVDDYVAILHNSYLEPDHISVSAWVNSSRYQQYQEIVRKGNNSGTESYSVILGEPNSNNIRFSIYDGAWQSGPYTVINLDTWYFVVGTYDGSTIRLYLDGIEVGTPVSYSGAVGKSGDDLEIGRRGSGDRQFDGTIDEVRIYNRALSEDEIKQLYRIGERSMRF